jgi:transposase, IS30 family
MASRLSLSEREEIRVGLVEGRSYREIAAFLGRAPSTVCREVGRNRGREGYSAVTAEERAGRLARRPRPFKLVADTVLAEAVTELICGRRYSPKTASKLLEQQGMRVSHETIYRACYQRDRGLGPDVWKYLVRRRQRRRHAGPRWGIASGNPLGNPVSVHQRPQPALARTEPGHLEGDLIVGSRNQSAVITIIDRVSRYTWLKALPNGYKTDMVTKALSELLTQIPPPLRRTLTWDQGREMRYWPKIVAETGTPIYVCDRHSPWQRPTVENNNGVLRRWLPKATDLTTYTQTHLDEITHLINNMPRQIHNWQTATTIHQTHLGATTG